ncbi:MAG: chromate transporter, partial [Spirochaetia bacterium]|nr:chromate transporter [Spirochaetia bacterium]
MEQSRHFLILFRTFLKIGAFTLGGGYAMLPLMEREFVSRRRWITEEEMVDIIAVVQSLP